MPKSMKKTLPRKILHPKSRKALQLTKETKRISAREKVKLVHHVKQNLLGEKLLWFRNHLGTGITKYTPELTLNLIELYLGRFKEELEQIHLKHSVGSRKNRQHASREDIIKLTLLREEEEFSTCGLEIPNVMDCKQLEMLRTWNGELRFLQNFRLRRFNRKSLQCPAASSRTGEELQTVDSRSKKSRQDCRSQTKDCDIQNIQTTVESEAELKPTSEKESRTVECSMDVDG